MFRVTAMDENLSLEGFESVWQRVTERIAKLSRSIRYGQKAHEQAVCLVKHNDTSCAVRFIPKF
jgi:hypothetical protein